MKQKSKRTLTPKLRFPEFRDRGEWQTPQLSDLYDFKRTNTLSRGMLNYEAGTIRNIHYGDIHTKFQSLFRVENEHVPFINPETSVDAFEEEDDCEKGDIVLADASEDLNDVGKAIEIISLDEQRVVAGTHTILATRRGDVPIIGFGGHLFQSAAVRTGIQRESQGAKVYGISANRISSVALPLPPTNSEQQKIAECLNSLDGLIAAEGRKLAALRDHKRGLMQQLFPQPGQTQPRLRFPEFRVKGEWEKKKAGSLFSQRKEKGETGLPIYSVTINDGMVLRSTFDRNFYDIEDPAGNKKACKNDIAYNMMRMWQGACGVAPEDCMVSPAYVVLNPKKGTCPAFIDLLFKRPAILHLLMVYSRGLTLDRLRLYFDDFASIPLLVPAELEQQRIAECLSSLDTRITAQAAKIESLKQHKRGLMQQLFPAPEEV